MCISLEMRQTGLQWEDCLFELLNADGVAHGDVERSRRAISDARHESIAQHVQWQDEQSAHLRLSKMDTAKR